MRKAARAIIVHDKKLLVMHRNKFGQEYYVLIGGGVEMGETNQQALTREIAEETGVAVSNPRLVLTEDAGLMYGMQYVYLCDYQSGEPQLSPESDEFKITALGQNIYTPVWLPVEQIPASVFRSERLKQALIKGIAHGFQKQPVAI